MRTIVIYPGRFQPFGKHHYETYKWAVGKFGADNVYISTSDSVDDKSPLNFEEKSGVIQKYGITKDRICKSDRPYMPVDLLNNFDRDKDRLIVIYGEKDYGRLSFQKKDGTPSYFKKYVGQHDLQSFKDSAYVSVAPHTRLNHNGNEICGTYLRQVLPNCTRKEMFDLLGWVDEKFYSLFKRKFQTDLGFVKESFHALSESAITKTQLQRLEQYADSLFFRFGIDIDFKTMTKDSHFYQRLNDPRNHPEISADEVRQLFKKVSQKHGEILSKANSGAEGVLKDMTSDINIPFIIKWDKEHRELDLIPKTIMRKKDFSTSSPVFQVEQFKAVLEATTHNKGIYTKHIMHPFECDMKFSELKRLVFDLTKNVQAISQCSLKLDGYNFQVTVKDGRILCSRNKSTVMNPMTYDQLRDKYVNKPDVQFAFCEAFKAMEGLLGKLSVEASSRIFNNGSTFINFEIIHDRAKNVFKYTSPALSIHSLVTYDSSGNESHRSNVMPSEITTRLGVVVNGFVIIETPKIELKPIQSANLIGNELLSIQHRHRIPESTNIMSLPSHTMSDIRAFVFRLGNEVIKTNCPFPDSNKNVNGIISIIEYVGDSLSSDSELRTFDSCLELLNRLGGYEAINPVEGLVFQWGDRMLKLTGSFGLLVPIFSLWNKKRF